MLLSRLSADEKLELLARWRFWARPEQVAPEGDWTTWVFLGGRGAGKTRAGAEWLHEEVRAGRAGQIALVAETLADARDVMIEGVSGLIATAREGERPYFEPSKRRLTWPNGAVALIFSAEDPESLRGPQFDCSWADEFAKWRYVEATWSMLQFALRLGERPRQMVTTTPRPIPALKRLLAEPGTIVTRAATFANSANLAASFLSEVARRYGGTALGRQELDGEIIEEVKGALWSRAMIDRALVAAAPALTRIVVARAELPIVMEQATAQGIADTWLMETWTARETATFRLPPSCLALDQGDVVELVLPARTLDLQIDTIADAGARAIEAKATDPSLAERVAGPGRGLAATPPPFYGAPLMTFLDLPLLTGDENPAAPHAAVYAKPWPGAVAVYRSGSDAAYALNTQLPLTATVGETITDFYAGATGRWERGNAVWVRLYEGALASAAEGEVLDGANLIAIANADGGFEVLQFQTAELVDGKTYRLTGFLRGQGGTAHEMRNPVAIGARVVVLDAAVRQLALTLDDRNRPFNWRSGPASLPIGDPAFVTETRAFAGIGLRPLSPVHLRWRRPVAGGDITIEWIRRTRLGGDAWDGADVPLGEDEERYAVDILASGTVLRTLTSASPSLTYTAADQTIDFGSATLTMLDVAVAQVSAVFGRGIAAATTLHL